jgi:hypothetical protein
VLGPAGLQRYPIYQHAGDQRRGGLQYPQKGRDRSRRPRGGLQAAPKKGRFVSQIEGALTEAESRQLHAHRLVGLVHVLHASGFIALFNLGLRHVEMHRRFLLLRGVGHFCDHAIHLLHVSFSALARRISRRKAHNGHKGHHRERFEHDILLRGLAYGVSTRDGADRCRPVTVVPEERPEIELGEREHLSEAEG